MVRSVTRFLLLANVAAGSALVATACAGEALQSQHSQALVLLPGATSVERSEQIGAHIQYLLNAAFPAAELRAQLARTLESDGWKRLTHDPIFPDVPATDEFQDVRYKTGATGKRWVAGWVDENGDVQTYEFRYPDMKESSRLAVSGGYLTPDEVTRTREALDKLNRQ
jgi:hypothetical protein